MGGRKKVKMRGRDEGGMGTIRAWCSCNGAVSKSRGGTVENKKEEEDWREEKVTNIMQGREENARR